MIIFWFILLKIIALPKMKWNFTQEDKTRQLASLEFEQGNS